VGEAGILFWVEDVESVASGFGDGPVKFHHKVIPARADGFFDATSATHGNIFCVPRIRGLMRGDGGRDPADSGAGGGVSQIKTGGDAGFPTPLNKIYFADIKATIEFGRSDSDRLRSGGG